MGPLNSGTPYPAPTFVSRAPSHPGLARFVERLWVFRCRAFPHELERIVPDGRAQLLVNLDEDELRTVEEGRTLRFPGAVIEGAFPRGFVIDTAQQRAILGVNFAATGLGAFLPAQELAGQRVGLTALGMGGLRERLLSAPSDSKRIDLAEAALVGSVQDWEARPALAWGAAALERGVRVAAVASHLGMSPRRFRERFVRRVGLRPKRFARLRRIQALLARLDERPDWADLAYALGFADQAHLSREFRDIVGVSPTDYAPRDAGDTNHLPL